MNDKIGLLIVSWTILEADLLQSDGRVADDAVGPDPGETLQAGLDARRDNRVHLINSSQSGSKTGKRDGCVNASDL